MTQMLVLEFDETLRDSLRDLLADVGQCPVTAVATETEGLEVLKTSSDPLVVVVSNQDADHHRSAWFFAQVVNDPDRTARHRYIMLSTNPAAMPPSLQSCLTQLHAIILGKPFTVDELLNATQTAVAQLAS